MPPHFIHCRLHHFHFTPQISNFIIAFFLYFSCLSLSFLCYYFWFYSYLNHFSYKDTKVGGRTNINEDTNHKFNFVN